MTNNPDGDRRGAPSPELRARTGSLSRPTARGLAQQADDEYAGQSGGTEAASRRTDTRPWRPVMLNVNYSKPLWGAQKLLGPYLRHPPSSPHVEGDPVATSDRDEAQQWADDLNDGVTPPNMKSVSSTP